MLLCILMPVSLLPSCSKDYNVYTPTGHAGWLGWPANLSPAAQLFAQVYNNASKPASLRGLATNVANYNG